MNRIQFFILSGLSLLFAVLVAGQLYLTHSALLAQEQAAGAQQVITQGNASASNLKQLAVRVFTDSQKTNDPGLKDLLARQQITYTPNATTNSTETPASPGR